MKQTFKINVCRSGLFYGDYFLLIERKARKQSTFVYNERISMNLSSTVIQTASNALLLMVSQ